jgi:hypothetical protein
LKTFRLGILCFYFSLLWACGGGGGGDAVVDEVTNILTPPEPSLVSTDIVPLMKATPDECYVKVDDEGHWTWHAPTRTAVAPWPILTTG